MAGSLVLRLDAFDFFAAVRVERVINILVRTFVWLLFGQEAGPKHTVGIAVLRIEIKDPRIRNQVCVAVAVFPFTVGARISRCDQIIRDLIFKKWRLGAILHRPVVPLPVEIVKINNRSWSEFHAGDFIRWRSGAGMVPWPDNEKMFRTRRG